MRIKHWQGYGCVNARKLSDRNYADQYVKADNGEIFYSPRIVRILVEGEHEWGLDRHDYYDDCYNWLLKRFVKGVEEKDILHINYKEDYSEHKAVYGFILNVAEKTFY